MLLHAKLTNPRLSSVVSTQSAAKIEELIQEDHNVKRKREKFQLSVIQGHSPAQLTW